MAFATVKPSDSAQTIEQIVRTSDLTLNRNDCPCLISNEGAGGAVVITLPQDARGGEVVWGVVVAAQALRFDPGAAGAIYCHDGTSYAKQADNKYVGSSTAGHRIMLVATGDGDWFAAVQMDGAGAVGFNTVET